MSVRGLQWECAWRAVRLVALSEDGSWHQSPVRNQMRQQKALQLSWKIPVQHCVTVLRCQAVQPCSQTMLLLFEDYSFLMVSSECSLQPGQAGFYSLLPLACLLCYWLVSRACRHGQVNHYRLLVADVASLHGKGRLQSLIIRHWSNLLLGSVQGVENRGRAAVWKGSHWPCGYSHKFYSQYLLWDICILSFCYLLLYLPRF